MTEKIPVAIHEGKLKLGNFEIEFVVLDTGQRLITQAGVEAFLNYLVSENPPASQEEITALSNLIREVKK